jgi:hypothetical protein
MVWLEGVTHSFLTALPLRCAVSLDLPNNQLNFPAVSDRFASRFESSVEIHLLIHTGLQPGD